MPPRACLCALLVLALAGCGAQADARYAAALRLWQSRPLAHYTLHTREIVGGRPCAQIVEVRDERLVRVLNNTCQHPNLWTISWLFTFVAKSSAPPDRCAQVDPSGGCVCRDAVDLQVEYDPTYGYPSTIVARQTWRADWQSMGYWWYSVRHLALASCASPFTDPGRRVVVREVKLLP